MPRMGDMVHSESRFLKQEDVKQYGAGGVILTIQSVEIQNVGFDDKLELKPVVTWMDEGVKPMVLNITNWQYMKMALGCDDDTDSADLWGRKVIVWADPSIKFQGRITGGLVIKPQQIENPVPQAAPVAPTAPTGAIPSAGAMPAATGAPAPTIDQAVAQGQQALDAAAPRPPAGAIPAPGHQVTREPGSDDDIPY